MRAAELEETLGIPGSVLLESARQTAADKRQLLFRHPERTVEAYSTSDVQEALKEVDAAVASGKWVAGYLAYECGYAFCLPHIVVTSKVMPLLWFGVYDEPLELAKVHVRPASVFHLGLRTDMSIDYYAYRWRRTSSAKRHPNRRYSRYRVDSIQT